jgi:hypothetical protein
MTFTKYRYDKESNQMVEKHTFKEIFSENWDSFVLAMKEKGKDIRPVIHEEIEKLINCQNPTMGTALYLCEDCNRIKHVPFTCKSRFCNTCGAKYSSERALNMSSVLIKGEHRHVVFTIPEELRSFFARDRGLLDVLFESVSETIYFNFRKRNKSLNYTPGFISVLHSFGRDLKWNPHIHVILCTKAVSKRNTWKAFNHFNYESLRKSWQYCLLKNLQQKIQTDDFKKLVDHLYKENKNGFYVGFHS